MAQRREHPYIWATWLPRPSSPALAILREHPYIRVTWLPELVAGKNPCEQTACLQALSWR